MKFKKAPKPGSTALRVSLWKSLEESSCFVLYPRQVYFSMLFYRHFVYDTFENTVSIMVVRAQLSAWRIHLITPHNCREEREENSKCITQISVCVRSEWKARGFVDSLWRESSLQRAKSSSFSNFFAKSSKHDVRFLLRKRRKRRLVGLIVLTTCLDFFPSLWERSFVFL